MPSLRSARAPFSGSPLSAYIWLGASLLVFLFLSRRPWGRYVYAVGSSEENSRLSGIKVSSVSWRLRGLRRCSPRIGGVIWTSRLGSGSPVGGVNYELESIAAVVVGGASLFGGRGRVDGVVAGVLIFGAHQQRSATFPASPPSGRG